MWIPTLAKLVSEKKRRYKAPLHYRDYGPKEDLESNKKGELNVVKRRVNDDPCLNLSPSFSRDKGGRSITCERRAKGESKGREKYVVYDV